METAPGGLKYNGKSLSKLSFVDVLGKVVKDQDFAPKINCLKKKRLTVLCSISSLMSPG